MPTSTDFEALERLKKYLASIRLNHKTTMERYVSDDRSGFYHQPRKTERASRSSTATCVSSLVRAGLWTSEFDSLWECTSAVADKLLARPWESAGLEENNPFTLSFIIEGVLDLQVARPDYENAAEHRRIIDDEIAPLLLQTLAKYGAISISPYPESAYLTQLAFRVLQRLKAVDLEITRKIHRWSRTEINKQLALLNAESRIADALQLAYALILAATSAPAEQTSPEDKQIFDFALAQFFAAQNKDGSWPYSRPLFHYPDVGNAYCFEYELLTQLLGCETLRSDLLPYIPKLTDAAQLLQRTRFDLDLTKSEKVVGWASGHHPQIEGPESWSTASVYDFAHALDRLVAEAIRRALFEELGAIYSPPAPEPRSLTDIKDFAPAPGFLDADLHYGDRVLSLRETIAKTFVLPIAQHAHRVARGGSLPPTTPMSAILFGPPGTSKTQLAKIISEFLGWPRLSVDPSYLVQQGLDRIQAMANRLFSMLTMAEQIVVLLDEFDEMGRDRARNQEVLSRFITTAMLPKLAKINEERKLVFLLATNYVSGFDAAFSRGGRFDMLIQVMPPSLDAKLTCWPDLKEALEKLEGSAKEAASIKLADLTYLETQQLRARLEPGMAVAEIEDQIATASRNGTLNKPNQIEREPGEDGRGSQENGTAPEDVITKRAAAKRMTWRDTSEAERRQIRLPGT